MNVQFDLGGGASLALPAEIVASRLIDCLRSQQAPAIITPQRTKIGEYLVGQGGIYIGDILGEDGMLYGLVVSKEKDLGKATWSANSGSLQSSAWDGLSNTNALRDHSPAAKLAAGYECDSHSDFYLPAQRELMIAAANASHLFDKDSWYWSSTAYGTGSAWAVDFEYGSVNYYGRRRDEFRVRPFRRFAH